MTMPPLPMLNRRPRRTRPAPSPPGTRSAAAPASSRAGRDRRRPGRSAPRRDTRAGARAGTARPSGWARTASPGSGLRRRTASRDSSSGCRAPRSCRSTASCRDGSSADRPGRPPLPVAEQDQLLAQHLHRARRGRRRRRGRRDASSGGSRPSACRGRPRSAWRCGGRLARIGGTASLRLMATPPWRRIGGSARPRSASRAPARRPAPWASSRPESGPGRPASRRPRVR